MKIYAVVAQLVEHSHGKGKVSGSSPDNGSRIKSLHFCGVFFNKYALPNSHKSVRIVFVA